MSKPILPMTVAQLRKAINDPRLKDSDFVFAGTYNDGEFHGVTAATVVNGELMLDMHPECETSRFTLPSEITLL